ncbi:F-box protein PP2-B15-like [Cucurbita moschata]|uniref:F-box protein PP2-B15-like n=1 Tax=Cucurbita moschata TaxID=3662 RepID=A0A6J1G450_CUCMO|nr:F-box protein PP2-B15-like [Cucurbita moschata]
MAGISSIGVLPEDCVSAILSLTTPTDAGKLSLVSSTFRSAAESDVVWSRFLPKNYAEIVAASDISGESPLCSKREAFFRLCSPILIEGGKKSFELERFSGKICYTLSARELAITWSSDPLCWSWKSDPQSRFAEVAELRASSWVEIHGRTRTGRLSPNTLYGAYLVVKTSEKGYGLDLMPAQVCVQLGDALQSSQGSVWLRRKEQSNLKMESLFYGNRRERAIKLFAADLGDNFDSNGIRDVRQREDGWSEIELGEFFTGEDDEHLTMSFLETKGFQLKSGLVVQAIQIRPKH